MGNGAVRQLPDLDTFTALTCEYDKLKAVGLSREEMHMILNKRLATSPNFKFTEPSPVDNSISTSSAASEFSAYGMSNKENATRSLETTKVVGPTAAEVDDEVNISVGLALLIDDSTVASRVASKVLSSLKFDVVTANSAKSGYELCLKRKKEIDIIFLDVVMPEVDGVECLGWLKDNAELSHIPVYMLSGLEDAMLSDVCIERGAEDMLLKPLNQPLVKKLMQKQQIGIKLKMVAPPVIINKLQTGYRNDDKHGSNESKLQSSVSNHNITIALSSNDTSVFNFQLADSEFHTFSFPSTKLKDLVLFVFVPTVFYAPLYSTNGLIKSLFLEHEKLLKSEYIQVVCVTADLPHALHSTKHKLNLPFQFLSDPSLGVCATLTDCVDIGKIMAVSDEDVAGSPQDDCKHRQNSFTGPSVSMVLLSNRTGTIVKRWKAAVSAKPNGDAEFEPFGESIVKWCTVDSNQPHKQRLKSDAQQHQQQQQRTDLSSQNGHTRDANKEDTTGTTSALTSSKSDNNITINDSAATNKSVGEVHVLVVDDSSVSSRVACKKLENMKYSVTCAYNGRQAFEILQKFPRKFSILLIDVVMPVCDGLELLKMIKQEDKLNTIPVIMLSGLEGAELVSNCLALGANGVMKKPFDELQFTAIVQEARVAIPK